MHDRPTDVSILKTFSPLDGMKAENLHALARKTQVLEIDAGRVLFKQGDTDKRTYYLVAGQVELRADDKTIGIVRSGSPEARAALAPGLPRKFTARALTDIEYIVIDSDLLDVLLTWDQTGQYEVAELRGDGMDVSGDWMTTLLQTKAFHRIPPANIQAIFMRCLLYTSAPGGGDCMAAGAGRPRRAELECGACARRGGAAAGNGTGHGGHRGPRRGNGRGPAGDRRRVGGCDAAGRGMGQVEFGAQARLA